MKGGMKGDGEGDDGPAKVIGKGYGWEGIGKNEEEDSDWITGNPDSNRGEEDVWGWVAIGISDSDPGGRDEEEAEAEEGDFDGENKDSLSGLIAVVLQNWNWKPRFVNWFSLSVERESERERWMGEMVGERSKQGGGKGGYL